MSTIEIVISCPHDGCDWTTSVDDDDPREAKYQVALHEEHAHAAEAPPVAVEQRTQERNAGSVDVGKTIGQLAAEERANDLARVITVRCADCLWEITGDQVSARRSWAQHRARSHDDDQAVEMVERSIAGDGTKRRPGRPVVGGKKQDVVENLAAVRAQGGGQHATSTARPRRARTMGAIEWTEEAALDAILTFHAEHERLPRQIELRSPLPSLSTVRRVFGGESAMREAARLRINGQFDASSSATSSEGPKREAAPPVKPPPGGKHERQPRAPYRRARAADPRGQGPARRAPGGADRAARRPAGAH